MPKKWFKMVLHHGHSFGHILRILEVHYLEKWKKFSANFFFFILFLFFSTTSNHWKVFHTGFREDKNFRFYKKICGPFVAPFKTGFFDICRPNIEKKIFGAPKNDENYILKKKTQKLSSGKPKAPNFRKKNTKICSLAVFWLFLGFFPV